MWFDFGRELDLVLCVLDSLNLLMSCRGQANRSFNQEGDIYLYMSIDKAIYNNPFFYFQGSAHIVPRTVIYRDLIYC